MSKNIVVEAHERTDIGKNASRRPAQRRRSRRRLRLGRPPFSVAVGARKIEEVLGLETGQNTIFTLALAGRTARAPS
jgi:hypothetical protein